MASYTNPRLTSDSSRDRGLRPGLKWALAGLVLLGASALFWHFSGPSPEPSSSAAPTDSGKGASAVAPEQAAVPAAPSPTESAVTTWWVQASALNSWRIEPTVQTGGYGGVVYDYEDETHFKFAAVLAGTGQVALGHRDELGWHLDTTLNYDVDAGRACQLTLTTVGTQARLAVAGQSVLEWTYGEKLTDGGVGLFTLKGASFFSRVTFAGYPV